MRPSQLLTAVGQHLAQARAQAGLSVEEAARRAAVSSRYLRMAEAGQANLSLLKLAALAAALHIPLAALCDIPVGDAPALRIALLGVRGAGKTSLGRALAQALEVPFFELDLLIEERAGLTLAQLFAIHGEDHYRQLQREVLESWLAQHGSGVLATGGSIVEDEDTYDRLCATCRTVWLRASAEDLWQRVIGQGDRRPMANHPRAKAELNALLARREPRYARADFTVETTTHAPTDPVPELVEWALG
jgi:XRE family aerobic/anaerobic benzoate catabolism transcriptional regulator